MVKTVDLLESPSQGKPDRLQGSLHKLEKGTSPRHFMPLQQMTLLPHTGKCGDASPSCLDVNFAPRKVARWSTTQHVPLQAAALTLCHGKAVHAGDAKGGCPLGRPQPHEKWASVGYVWAMAKELIKRNSGSYSSSTCDFSVTPLGASYQRCK